MPTRKQRLLALLATGRVANLPTVATHVGVAFLLSRFGDGLPMGLTHYSEIQDFGYVLFYQVTLVALGSLIYLGGCFLGDAIDARFDENHRPERPIPQGVLSARGVAITGYAFLFIAWLAACLLPTAMIITALNIPFSDVVTAVLSGMIMQIISPIYLGLSTALVVATIAYARYHKALGPFAPVLMALCRALLVAWAASAAHSIELRGSYLSHTSAVLLFVAATFLYTLCLSLVARNESDPNAKLPSLALKITFAFPPLLLTCWLVGRYPETPFYTDLLPLIIGTLSCLAWTLTYLAWTLYSFSRLKNSVPAFVSAALAGFCLMDACFAALIGWPVALACLALFLLALLLQRIAPAT